MNARVCVCVCVRGSWVLAQGCCSARGSDGEDESGDTARIPVARDPRTNLNGLKTAKSVT